MWRERADLADKVEQLESDLVRFKELETLLRTTLVSAERASTELKEQARREADLILGEAHAEARKVRRDATAENERLISSRASSRRSCVRRSRSIDDVQDAEDAPATKDDGQNTWPGEREAA